MQLRLGLEKKDAAPFHLNTCGVCRQDEEQSSWGRDRSRGGRGRRGRGGMGGHGKWRAGAGGNCGIPEECTSDNRSDNDGGQSGDGIGRGGSGRGGDGGGGGSGRGGGGWGVRGGGGNGGNNLIRPRNERHTPTQHARQSSNRILITNAKKVWGTLRSTTPAALLKAIERFASPKSLVKYLSVKRKYKLSRDGQVKKWWFVVRADVSNINLLEQEWLNISIHTGWSLENLYRYEDSIPSNVLPDLPDQQLQQPEGPQKILTTQVHNTSTLSPTSPTGTETVTHSEVITTNVTNVTTPISNSILSGSQQQQLENAFVVENNTAAASSNNGVQSTVNQSHASPEAHHPPLHPEQISFSSSFLEQ